MAGIIWTPGKRERQPQAGAQLSDVGRSALFLASAGSERPLVVSGVAAKIASANGSTVAGGGHGFLATSTAVAQMSLKTAAGTQSSIALASGMSWTFLVHVKITAMNLPNPGFWRSGAGGATGNTYCNVLSGRWPSIRTDGTNVIAPSSGPELAVGFEGVIAYTNASARSAAIAWDGVVRHSATHSTAQTADTIEAFGFQYGPSESVSGVYYSIAMLPRAFSFKELEECTTVAGYYSLLFEPENDPVFYSLGGGGAALIDVPAGAVTITGYAPTVTAGGTASTSVPAGAVTLTAYAPTVTAGGTASTSVPLGTVTLTGYAPTVTVGGAASIDVPLGTVALTGYAPTVTTGGQAQIDVPLGTVTLTGYVPTVTTTEHVYIAVPTAAMTLAAYAPTVTTSGTPDTWTPVSASTGTWTPASAAGGTWTPQ